MITYELLKIKKFIYNIMKLWLSMGTSMKLLKNKCFHASDGKSSQAAESLFVLPSPVATLEKWQLRFMGAVQMELQTAPPQINT
jgi:hypothetical protein